MLALEYIVIALLFLAIFPFSIIQMGTALEQEDIEAFCVWTFLASTIAGLPLMTVLLI
ncbi:hypothetical protein [[Phormidium] sp. LEGE 05292]|uniref:hypothetical protein n=1 Tax=[Phormidium] sp. LEGE 05292 TaxID=767427 RepID=UPI00187E266B|nr:hypothetical protein [Phormidium sp. LEGE 05292]